MPHVLLVAHGHSLSFPSSPLLQFLGMPNIIIAADPTTTSLHELIQVTMAAVATGLKLKVKVLCPR